MSALTLVTMILVLTVVWGGLITCVATALRREAKKSRKPR